MVLGLLKRIIIPTKFEAISQRIYYEQKRNAIKSLPEKGVMGFGPNFFMKLETFEIETRESQNDLINGYPCLICYQYQN